MSEQGTAAQERFSAAFPELYAAAYRMAYPVVGDGAECQDIAAEALARALASWARVEPHARPWVCRVAVNLALDRKRRERRARAYEAAPIPGPVDDVHAAERLDLAVALGQLPRRQAQTVYLRYVVDCSERETAEVLGIAPGTVKAHAARGLRALRQLVDIPLTTEDLDV